VRCRLEIPARGSVNPHRVEPIPERRPIAGLDRRVGGPLHLRAARRSARCRGRSRTPLARSTPARPCWDPQRP